MAMEFQCLPVKYWPEFPAGQVMTLAERTTLDPLLGANRAAQRIAVMHRYRLSSDTPFMLKTPNEEFKHAR